MKKIANYIEKYTGLKPLDYNRIMNNKALYDECRTHLLEPIMFSFEEDDFAKILTSSDVKNAILNGKYTHFVEDYNYLCGRKIFKGFFDDSLNVYGNIFTEKVNIYYNDNIQREPQTGLYITGFSLKLRLVNINAEDENFGPINKIYKKGE